MTTLRFIIELGNPRIEELDDEGDIVKALGADMETVRGFFKVWEKENMQIKTINELEEVVMQY